MFLLLFLIPEISVNRQIARPTKCEGLGLLLMPCYVWDLPRSQRMQRMRMEVEWEDLMEIERVPFVNFARPFSLILCANT